MTSLLFPFWRSIPVFRLLLPFTIGIVIQFRFTIPFSFSNSIIIPCIILSGAYCFLNWKLRDKFSLLFSIILTITFIMLGMMLTRQNTPGHTVKSLVNSVRENDVLQITLEEKTVKKIKTYKANAAVNYIVRNNELIPVDGKIIVYFKNSNAPPFGSRLLIRGRLQTINGSGNPGNFDYRQYALMQGLTHQIFLSAANYVIIDSIPVNKLSHFLESSRDKVIDIIRRFIPDNRNAGLAEALLIGYKNDLDKRLVNVYSNTGVVHIIAISGLHVGLIYLLLLYAFKPLQHIRLLKQLSPIFILLALWLFTLLAGAQPSVLRSTIMFSFIAVGQLLIRQTNMFNSLALSAFFLLCYNPFWLWDIGFQLSYAAVFSILIFAGPIYRITFFRNRIVDTTWKLLAVTIAAQILTTPFCIYYFHQFPVYFLVSNLVAVPLSGLILFSEIFLLLISPFEGLATYTGILINEMIRLMNYCIDNVQHLPFALIDNLQINFIQAALLSIFLFCFGRWLLVRSIFNLRVVYFSLLSFLVIHLYSIIHANQQRMLIIYNIQPGMAIDFIAGRNSSLKADSIISKDLSVKENVFKPSHAIFRIKNSSISCTSESGNLYTFFGKRMLVITQPILIDHTKEKIPIDILYVDSKVEIDLRQLASKYSIKWIVLGNKIPERNKLKYRQLAADYGVPLHILSLKGAFVITPG